MGRGSQTTRLTAYTAEEGSISTYSLGISLIIGLSPENVTFFGTGSFDVTSAGQAGKEFGPVNFVPPESDPSPEGGLHRSGGVASRDGQYQLPLVSLSYHPDTGAQAAHGSSAE